MRMCQSHWDMLRKEVVAQGMGDLVSANGDIMAMKMIAELQAERGDNLTRDDFDPLMSCWIMVMNRMLELVGPGAMTEHFGCPICFLNTVRNKDGSCPCPDPQCKGRESGSLPDFETWLVGESSCVAVVREHCVQEGWLS